MSGKRPRRSAAPSSLRATITIGCLGFWERDHDGCYRDLSPALGFPTQGLKSKQLVWKPVLASLSKPVPASEHRPLSCMMGQSQVLFGPLSLAQMPLPRGRGGLNIRTWRTLLTLRTNAGWSPGLCGFVQSFHPFCHLSQQVFLSKANGEQGLPFWAHQPPPPKPWNGTVANNLSPSGFGRPCLESSCSLWKFL